MKKQIKFSSLQRFNLEDASDLQGLVDQQLKLENFGLKGGGQTGAIAGGMILSPFVPASVGAGTNSGTAFFTLNAFTFMLPIGDVIQHTNSALQISYSTLRNEAIAANAAKTGYLWGNYNNVETENEPREFWDTLSETEIVQNVNTRIVKTPTFVVTTTTGQPAAIDGRKWTRLATITCAASGGTFKVVNVDAIRQYNEMPGYNYYKALDSSSSTASKRYGFGPYWENIEEMFFRLITNGSSDPSGKVSLARGSLPQYSLQGLKREIDKKENIGVVASCLLRFAPNPDFDTNQSSSSNTDFYPYLRSDVEVLSASNCNVDPTQTRFDGQQSTATDPALWEKFRNGVFQVIVTSDAGDAADFGQGRVVSDATALSIYNTNKVVLTAYAKHDTTTTALSLDAGLDGEAVDILYPTSEPVNAKELFSIVVAPWYPDEGYDKTNVSKLYYNRPDFANNTYATFINFEPWNMFTTSKRLAIFNRYFVQEGLSGLALAFRNHQDQTITLGDDFKMPEIFLKVEFLGDVSLIK